MNRESFLEIHNVDPQDWAKRYSLVPIEIPCRVCGEAMKTSQPIAIGDLRGLKAAVCVCGNEDTPYCFVMNPAKGDLISSLTFREQALDSKMRASVRRRGPIHQGLALVENLNC